MRCLVIDFGGTLTKFCLMDEKAEIAEKGELPSPLVGVDSYVSFVEGLCDKHKGRIDGVAISMPGMIDVKSGLLKGGGAFMDLWGKNLYDLIRRAVSLPFSIENDGKCGALAEVWQGNLKDVRDGAVMIIGTGNAGGIIKDRAIHHGFHDTAGEVSYLMTRPGEYGAQNMMCMQAAMMGLTMKAAAAKGYGSSALESGALKREDAAENLGLGGMGKEGGAEAGFVIDGPQIFKWLEEGDPAIAAIYRDFIANIGMMLFNIQVVFDPEKIAVGGGVSRVPRLIPDIQAELDRIEGPLIQFNVPRVKLVPCKFLGEANLVGAMYNYLRAFHPEMAG